MLPEARISMYRIGLKLTAIFLVAVPGWSQTAPLRLTLEDAIQRGLKSNLAVLVADSRVAEARGTAERRQSALYPRVRIDTPITIQTRNLRAQGISFPGLPDVVGPFTTYDFRASADQSILDLTALHASRAAKESVKAVRSDYQDARDQVIRNVASLYLSCQSAAALTESAKSRVDTAQVLYQLALDQRDAGVATGIDVLRAQVQLAHEKQGLVQASNAAKESLLVLARNIGLSPGTPIELAEKLSATNVPMPTPEEALANALDTRPDYQALAKQRDVLNEQVKASNARFYPRLSANANYGGIGRTFSQITGTGAAQLSLSFTVFDRDRQGERKELEARLDRISRQAADMKLGIEQDIRQALLRLDSATEEVTVAVAGLDLAQKELDLAKYRFQNGVTNNVEVVNAQDSLARAQQNHIVALTHHADARIMLSRALGNTENTYSQYLGSH
ncbi:MAG TPA: TolC family protein [Terriglobales bacterium]|nr:TolC family protein [Terriglobales bacterium]